MSDETRRLLSLIDRFPLLRVAVWGDFILDEYVFGTTRRISREAPVLILSYRNREFALGGAGNAALNLRALGVETSAIGVVGADEGGRRIRRILQRAGVSVDGLIARTGYATPLKTRILAGDENTKAQQILRIDREGEVPDDPGMKTALAAALETAAASCDALLVSDYHYRTVKIDVFKQAAARFKAAGAPVTLDSRFRLTSFTGVTAATPNEPEVEDALKTRIAGDRRALLKAARSLQAGLRSPALVVTLGSRGMALFEKGRPAVFLPVHGSTDIVDVTGAGDTVIGVFTASLAAGATFIEAARLSNIAGGLVVMKKGTAVVPALELKRAVESER